MCLADSRFLSAEKEAELLKLVKKAIPHCTSMTLYEVCKNANKFDLSQVVETARREVADKIWGILKDGSTPEDKYGDIVFEGRLNKKRLLKEALGKDYI